MSDTILSAEAHFEALREAVWTRFSARHRTCTRDAFEDAYAEWWTREVERAAAGRPSHAEAPTAFVAEAVHRVLIDDLRARARGLAREDKGKLEIIDLDAQMAAADTDDTASQASYEALAHRVVTLVRGRLSERELKVFVWSYLYLQSTDRTAVALGLSHPRVKKDRKRIATKVGQEVWAVLSGELELCAAYEDKHLLAVFEILTVHVEDCPTCRAALGGVRRGALAICGPVELLALAGGAEEATHAVAHLIDGVAARLHGLAHRATEMASAVPPNGRTAAVAVVAAGAMAGGAATVKVIQPTHRDHPAAQARHPRHAASPVARATPAPVRTVSPSVTPEHPAGTATVSDRRTRSASTRRRPSASATPKRESISSFEVQARSTPAQAAATASNQTATSPQSGSAPAPASGTSEFGFEHH